MAGMIDRTDYLKQLAATVRRSPVTALVGPRFPINRHISAWPLRDVATLRGELR